MKLHSVLKKELHAYFFSPIIFCLLTVCLALCGYLFYSNIVMTVMFQGTAIRVDLWQYTFNDIRFVLMFVLPVVSMRLLAEEKRLGTLELLMTNPLKTGDIIIGKYVSCLTLLCIILLCTTLYPLLYEIFFNLDRGVILAGYLGLFLLGASVLSLGIFISSLTNSQLIAAIATLGTGFLLWFIDRSEEYASEGVVSLLSHLSFQKHFFNFNRGVLALEDVGFFAAFSLFFLYLTAVSIKAQSTGIGFKIWKQNRTANLTFFTIILKTALVFLLALSTYLISYTANIRLDLTRDKVFSLSPVTLNALNDLEKTVNLKAFYETGRRYTFEDFLSLMARTSPYFSFRMLNLQRNASMASFYGIENHGAGVLAFEDGEKKLPTVTEAGIVNALLSITVSTDRTVLITRFEDFQQHHSLAVSLLRRQGFRVENLDISAREEIPPGTHLVIFTPDHTDISPEESRALKNYFDRGGNILLMADPAPLPDTKGFLSAFNIDIEQDSIVDREHTLFEAGQHGVVIFFNREHPVTATLSSPAVFPNARSVQVGTQIGKGLSWTILAQTGRRAEKKLLDAPPEKESRYSGRISTGVAVEKRRTAGEETAAGRMIVLGSASFIQDGSIALLSNRNLFHNAVKWLTAHDERLVEIEMAPAAASLPVYINPTESQGRTIFWSAVVLLPLAVFIAGVFVVYRKHFML